MESNERNIEQLLADFCRGEISDRDLIVLHSWMEEKESHRKQAVDYIKLYRNARAYQAFDELNTDKALENILSKVRDIKRRRRMLYLRNAAAVAVLLVASVFVWQFVKENKNIGTSEHFSHNIQPGNNKAILLLDNGVEIDLEEIDDSTILLDAGTSIRSSEDVLDYQHIDVKKEVYNTLIIPRGGRHTLVLADGTRVWVNSETTLRYPVSFVGKNREVYLTGEAYFEVSKNAEKAFLVHTPQTLVKVFGTAFNVSSYPDDKMEATTLVEGSVSVLFGSEETLLKPGQQSQIYKEAGQLKVEDVDTYLYTAWKDGIFRFEAMSLEEMSAKLGRWYDVDFVFGDDDSRKKRFTGAVKKDTDFDFFMKLINETTQVDIEIQENNIYVKSGER